MVYTWTHWYDLVIWTSKLLLIMAHFDLYCTHCWYTVGHNWLISWILDYIFQILNSSVQFRSFWTLNFDLDFFFLEFGNIFDPPCTHCLCSSFLKCFDWSIVQLLNNLVHPWITIEWSLFSNDKPLANRWELLAVLSGGTELTILYIF